VTLDDLAREFSGWHLWLHAGQLYARRLNASPPRVVTADTVPELAEKIKQVRAELGDTDN
jgi:hypothetical protein